MRQVCAAVATSIIFVTSASAEVLGPCRFDTQGMTFAGTPVEQARCLLRTVKIRGALEKPPVKIGEMIERRVGTKTAIDSGKLSKLLSAENLGDLAAFLDEPVSRTAAGLPALYFIIHDTSQKYPGKTFPSDDDAGLNRLGFRYSSGDWVAHAFINRLGRSLVAMDFSTPWRATKLENRAGSGSRGRFLHIENTQPRLDDPANPAKDDNLAPATGLTDPQYRRLAILYTVASHRAGMWLIPGFHGVIDHGIGTHDDPQNFDRPAFEAALATIVQAVES